MDSNRLQQLKHWGLPIIVALLLGMAVVYGNSWWATKAQESQNVRDLVTIINYNIRTGAIKVPPTPQVGSAPEAPPVPAPAAAPAPPSAPAAPVEPAKK